MEMQVRNSCHDSDREYAPHKLGHEPCCICGNTHVTVCGDLDDDIGDGLTGGSNMEEVEASRESSGSVGGAGGRDLRLERGMLG